jgi:hypothetical protein
VEKASSSETILGIALLTLVVFTMGDQMRGRRLRVSVVSEGADAFTLSPTQQTSAWDSEHARSIGTFRCP